MFEITSSLSFKLQNSRPPSSLVLASLSLFGRLLGCWILSRKCGKQSKAIERSRTGSADAYITALFGGAGGCIWKLHTSLHYQPPTLMSVHNPCPHMYLTGQVSVSTHLRLHWSKFPPDCWSVFVWRGHWIWMSRPMVCKLIFLWVYI